jgi:hypothetical protein
MANSAAPSGTFFKNQSLDLRKLTNCLVVQQQGYNTPISTSMATSDPYMSNYYGTTSFPYQAFGVGDGTWSNGGDPMTFLGGYGGQMAAAHESYNMEGMFGTGGFGTFNQPAGTLYHRKDVQLGFNFLLSIFQLEHSIIFLVVARLIILLGVEVQGVVVWDGSSTMKTTTGQLLRVATSLNNRLSSLETSVSRLSSRACKDSVFLIRTRTLKTDSSCR